MSKQIIVSAPGKLMLFGEHAVVYGKPCIVTAVDQRLSIKAEKIESPEFLLDAPDVDITNYRKPLSKVGDGEIPKGAKFVEVALANFIDSRLRGNDIRSGGIKFETVSQFKSVFGFGSSSASAVCAVKALSELFEIKLSEKEFFDICYKTVIDIQGVGSGFDLAAAIYGGTLYYVYPGKVIEPLSTDALHLIVGYTGIKADTPTIVKAVKEIKGKNPKLFDRVFDGIEAIVEKAKKALIENDFKGLGKLMDENQKLLEEINVSSKELDNLLSAARDAGAYGAKLSGAGIGDCMLALAPPSKRKAVEKAIEKTGGQVLKVKVNAEGVRIES